MSYPDKQQRAICWGARDKYWECLDNQKGPDLESPCKEIRKMFEASCSPQWVTHFDRRRQYLKYKEKIEKDGIPTKKTHEKSFAQPRRVYRQIACNV